MSRRAVAGLIALGALALAASYPPFTVPALSFCAVIPAVLLLRRAGDARTAFRWGFWYGVAAQGLQLADRLVHLAQPQQADADLEAILLFVRIAVGLLAEQVELAFPMSAESVVTLISKLFGFLTTSWSGTTAPG